MSEPDRVPGRGLQGQTSYPVVIVVGKNCGGEGRGQRMFSCTCWRNPDKRCRARPGELTRLVPDNYSVRWTKDRYKDMGYN